MTSSASSAANRATAARLSALCQPLNEHPRVQRSRQLGMLWAWDVQTDDPAGCPACKGKQLRQEEDVLDTWFSSQLWPFATLGWPDETPELGFFYPTTVLSTARDILFLWVARMIMSGLDFIGDVPYRDVIIHPTVFNAEGKRMSKSLGTGVDPLDLMAHYGADGMRFGLMLQVTGNQGDGLAGARQAQHGPSPGRNTGPTQGVAPVGFTVSPAGDSVSRKATRSSASACGAPWPEYRPRKASSRLVRVPSILEDWVASLAMCIRIKSPISTY